jgi:hypothetical protein
MFWLKPQQYAQPLLRRFRGEKLCRTFYQGISSAAGRTRRAAPVDTIPLTYMAVFRFSDVDESTTVVERTFVSWSRRTPDPLHRVCSSSQRLYVDQATCNMGPDALLRIGILSTRSIVKGNGKQFRGLAYDARQAIPHAWEVTVRLGRLHGPGSFPFEY